MLLAVIHSRKEARVQYVLRRIRRTFHTPPQSETQDFRFPVACISYREYVVYVIEFKCVLKYVQVLDSNLGQCLL